MGMFPRATTQNRLGDNLPAHFDALLDTSFASSGSSSGSSAMIATSPAEPPYLLPRDAQEQARQELEHYALRGAFQRNALAPIGAPASVLDVGCGAGHWAMEIAYTFPDAYVLGIDLTLPETDSFYGANAHTLRRPNNCTFMQCDALRPLPFADDSFTYTHMRLLHLGIPATTWPHVLNELVRVTHPRGWIELVESDLPRNGGPALDLLMGWVYALAFQRGIDPALGSRVGMWARERGLRAVVSHEVQLPLGAYGGRLGNMLAISLFALLDALRPALVASGITGNAQFEKALLTARFEVMRSQCIQPFYIAYGQR